MTRHDAARRLLRGLGACALVLAATAASAVRHTQVVEVEAGHQRLLVQSSRVTRVAVGDPRVADVQIGSPREVIVTGKTPGATSLMLWRAGETEPAQLLLRVTPMHASIPTGDYQVQIDLKIVELSRRALHAAGLTGARTAGKNQVAVAPPGILSAVEQFQPLGDVVLSSAAGFLPVADAFNLAYGSATEGLLAVLSVLESNGLAHTLAEPSLVAMSGHTATFLAGGEFPIPVIQNSGGSGGSVTIEFKEFGVSVDLTPTVLGPDRIVLKVAPEVSELDFSNGVQTAGVTVPALVTRRADTTIDLGDGETFALGGLVSRSVVASADKIPFLGDIPILGAFFKSTRFDRMEKELLMVAQAHLVRPLHRGAELPPLPGEEIADWNPSALRFFFLPNHPLSRWGAGFAD